MLKSAAALAAKVVAVAVEDEDDPENKFPIKGGSGRRERNALASGIQFEPAFVESSSSSSSSSSSFVVVVVVVVVINGVVESVVVLLFAAVEEKEEDKNAQNEFLLQQQQFQQQQQQQQQQASSSCARKADAVIILCGINDVKTCFLHGKIFFRENFENELENVIKEIKSVVGSDALVVLPGNPLHIAPLFPNPLREVILKLNDCWDDKKEKVANKLGKRKALFINSPTLQALRDAVRMHGGDSGGGIREGEFTARDGVHPNDMGYKAWANIIAAEVAKVLKDNEVQ